VLELASDGRVMEKVKTYHWDEEKRREVDGEGTAVK
jgi:hypothetical protein